MSTSGYTRSYMSCLLSASSWAKQAGAFGDQHQKQLGCDFSIAPMRFGRTHCHLNLRKPLDEIVSHKSRHQLMSGTKTMSYFSIDRGSFKSVGVD